MRALYVTPLYWPSIGGGEQVAQVLAERLAREDHPVTVLTTDAGSVERFWDPRGPRVAERDTVINGVRVIRVPIRPFPLRQPGLFAVRRLAIGVFDPLRMPRLVRAIGAWMPRAPAFRHALHSLPGPFDVVHGFNLSWESCLVDAYEFARSREYAYVMTPFLHTGEPGRARVSRNYGMSHQVDALRGSRRVIAQTPIEARAIEGMGVDGRRVVSVGIGVDPEQIVGGDAARFRARHGIRGPIVVFIGRATRDKGAMDLVRAMQHLWAGGLEAECIIAGLVLPDFARFLRAQSPLPRLQLIGQVVGMDKRDVLAAADVVVLPSRADSFGIVYLEGWVCGKPVIGAHAGGVPALVTDGLDGYLVPFGDPGALSARLAELIAHPERARALGEAGRRKVLAQYTWEVIYAKTLEVYRDAIGTCR